MKTRRVFSSAAFLFAVGIAQLVGCSSDSKTHSTEEASTGTISLPLQAVAASGNVYRLRNATFTITDNHTGNFVAVFSSEDDPSKSTISKVLDIGDYSITLLQGWFLERVSGSNGTGGASSGGAFSGGAFSGGAFTAGGGPIPGRGGSFNGPGGSPGKPLPVPGGVAGGPNAAAGSPGKPGQGGAPGSGGEFAGEGGSVEFPEGGVGGAIDEGFGGFIGFAGRQGAGGFFPAGGTSGGGVGVRVDATLTSNAVQFFSIFSRSDTFVSFSFQVGGEVLNFNQGRVNVGIDVVEVGQQCETPPNVTRPERVLLENDVTAVSTVRLRDVFNALASNGATKGDGELLFNQIYDSFASADQGLIPSAVHCGDEMTNGVPTLNGFPVDCNRIERLHVGGIDAFSALAIINRIDLAPENGANCGQQRMIFASNSFNRAFIIVEAQVPNPSPELGIAGCIPLAKFWMAQNDIADPIARGARLTEAFLKGSPELAPQGFGAFYTPENLTVGSGQIRTNQFDSSPWTLREFKLTQDGETLKSIPFPTAEAPNGGLWNDTNDGLPQGAACRENMLSALDGVLTGDLGQLSFVVDQQCRDSESRNDFSQAYAFQMSPGFRAQIAQKVAGTGLSPEQVANRAQFAGSCIGCHNESSGADLGFGVSAPFSSDFPHVTEFASTDCGARNAGSLCFPTSAALKDLFLPSRLKTLTDLLQVPIVTDPCGNGGSGGGFGTGGGFFGNGGSVFGSGGSFGVAGGFGKGGASSVTPVPKPAPNVVIQVASSGTAIPELVQEDASIRALSGARTIGGRSAQVTH